MDRLLNQSRSTAALRSICAVTTALVLTAGSVQSQDSNPELKKFQGDWEVVELVENGKVIAQEMIRDMLPSGGRIRVIENAIIFRSPKDQKQHARVFAIEATKYPRAIDLGDSDGKRSRGIYQFDQGKLIVCIADPDTDDRPDAFSAGAASQRMLMVLKRSPEAPKSEQSKPESSTIGKSTPVRAPVALKAPATLKGLSDADVTKMVVGTWVLKDSAGALYTSFRSDGTFNTVREYQELRLFHKSFVQTPISKGSWNVKNGQLSAYVRSSVEAQKVNRQFGFSVRSISAKDMIFTDQMGRVVRAARVVR